MAEADFHRKMVLRGSDAAQTSKSAWKLMLGCGLAAMRGF
jgi:hypothetical protein